jgi:hypothetical protein
MDIAQRMNLKMFFLVFFVSLNSYYFYSIKLPVFSLIGAVGIFFVFAFHQKKIFLSELCFALILLAINVFSIIGTLISDQNTSINIKSNGGCLILIFLLVALLTVSDYKEYKKFLIGLIVIHSFFFYINFIGYYFFHHYIDFLKAFTGEAQRYNLGSSFFIRPTGLFNEPATYAEFILLCTLPLLKEKTSFSKWIVFIGLMSVFLSFSLMGLIFLAMILAYFFKKMIFKNKIWALIFLMLVYFIFHKYIDAIAIKLFSKFHEGGDSDGRFSIFKNFDFASFNFYTLFFGPINFYAIFPLSSNLALFIHLFGFLGTFMLLCAFIYFFYQDFFDLLFVIITFLGIPIFIYPFYAVFIAGMFFAKREIKERGI